MQKKMFKTSPQPSICAEAVAAALDPSTAYKLRWPAGIDAVAMSAGRARMPDEVLVGYGAELDEPMVQGFWREWCRRRCLALAVLFRHSTHCLVPNAMNPPVVSRAWFAGTASRTSRTMRTSSMH